MNNNISSLNYSVNHYYIIAKENTQIYINSDSKDKIKINSDIISSDIRNPIEKEIEEIINTTYQGKKENSMMLAQRYKNIYNYSGNEYYKNKAERLENCSSYLAFGNINGTYKMVRTNLCRVRLCPMCSYKRSLSVYHSVRAIHDNIVVKNPTSMFLFITLTVQNVEGKELSKTIDQLNRGFQNIVRQKDFKKINLGTIRSIEITYNKKSHTYHPHIHILLHTTKELYKGRNYISQSKLCSMWESAANTGYMPIVDIRKLKMNTGKELAEIAKYAVKPTDYLNAPDNVLITLDDVLHKRHLISLSGSFKEAKRDLKIEDIEKNDIYREKIKDIEAELIIYKWHFGTNKYINSMEKIFKKIN